MTVNAMAGFAYPRGMPGMSSSIEMEGMKVTYKFDVPSTVGPDQIKANLDAHSDSKINEMLAMHIGTCAAYTVTVVASSHTTSMGDTVDSDGNAVTMASEGNEVTAATGGSEAGTATGGSEAATTEQPTSDDGAEAATTA